jgi:hypothetical protein
VYENSQPAHEAVVTYVVDRQDCLIGVNDAWWRFARENGADGLAPSSVVGRLLWELIPSAEPIFEPLLHAVRARGRAISVRFRCDAPAVRRLLLMDLVPGPSGQVEFRVTPLQTQQRTPVRLFASDGPRSAAHVVVCSWCKRVQVDLEWLEVEQAFGRLRLLEEVVLPQVSHGLCPRCAHALMRAADEDDAEPWVSLPAVD